MKKTIVVLAAIMVMAVLMEGRSFAASAASGTVTVQATIVAQCKLIGVNNITQTINFGSITPDETTGNTGVQTLAATNIRCTTGLPYTILYNSANYSGGWRMADGSGHFLLYTFTPTTAAGAGTGTGFATDIPLGGTMQIMGNDLQAAWSDQSAGLVYTDGILVDLQY